MKKWAVLLLFLPCCDTPKTEVEKIVQPEKHEIKNNSFAMDSSRFQLLGDSILIVYTQVSVDTFSNTIDYDSESKNRSFVFWYEYQGFDTELNCHVIRSGDWEGISGNLFLNDSTGIRFGASGYPIFSKDKKFFIDYSNTSFPIGFDGITLVRYDKLEKVWEEYSEEWYPDSVEWISDSAFSYYETYRDSADYNEVTHHIRKIRNLFGEIME